MVEKNRFDFSIPDCGDESSDYPDGGDESSDYPDGGDESSFYDIPKDRKYLVRCGGDGSSDYEISEDRKYLVRCGGGHRHDESFNSEIGRKIASIAAAMEKNRFDFSIPDCGDESSDYLYIALQSEFKQMEQGDGSSVGISNYDTEPMEKNNQYCGGDGSIDSDFLCARSKTHLIRCDGSPVEIASLRGKIVGILFFFYGKGKGEKGALSNDNLLYLKAFKEVYEWTREVKGDVFEIVSVALGCSPDDDKENWELERRMFDELILSDMPGLAVPFDEWEWRERLRVKYINSDRRERLRIDIVDGTSGRLVFESADSFIRGYGPYSYPFTIERLEEVCLEGERMLKQKSLEALLGDSSSGRDFLLSNNGTKVPISQLQGKAIGLYLCRETPFPASSATYPLYGNDCSGQDEEFVEFLLTRCPSDFNIVIINGHFCGGYTDETSFLQVLNRLPNNWLALPFKDVKTWALFANLPLFAIVGPDGDLLPHGDQFIERYGFDAYPFTLGAAANAEIQRLTQLNLADVFKALDIDSVYKKKLGLGEEDYALSSFPFPTPDKKGVVLYIHHCLPLPEASRLLDLSLSSPFHVIFYDSANTSEDSAKLFDTMPMQWFALPHGYHFFGFESLEVLFPGHGHVIAFGPYGNLLKVGTLESFGRHGNDVFPFISQEDFIMTVEKYLAEYHSRPLFLV